MSELFPASLNHTEEQVDNIIELLKLEMKYFEAVKQWNGVRRLVDTSHVWAVPRKATAEYDQVRAIMKGEPVPPAAPAPVAAAPKPMAAAAPKAAAPKASKAVDESIPSDFPASLARRRVRADDIDIDYIKMLRSIVNKDADSKNQLALFKQYVSPPLTQPKTPQNRTGAARLPEGFKTYRDFAIDDLKRTIRALMNK